MKCCGNPEIVPSGNDRYSDNPKYQNAYVSTHHCLNCGNVYFSYWKLISKSDSFHNYKRKGF